MRSLLVAAALIHSLPCPAALAQEAASAADRSAFDQAFKDYKEFVRQIENLRIEYQTANESRRDQINEEARQLIQSAQPKVKTMVKEALKLYVAAPESDKQITDLLISVAAHKMQGTGQNGQGGDQFEQALEVVRALIDGGNESPGLPSMGVIAAFCCNEYELAEQYAQLAKDRGDDTNALGEELAVMATDYSEPSRLEQYGKLWAEEKKLRDAEAAADDLPRVKFETTKGDIVIELFENEAPNTVANMISLVKDDFYDGTIFHRVLPHFMAQGGDPGGDGSGGPGYTIPCECYQDNARMHFRGSLSMAHAGRDTGGSQFFLTFVPTNHLNRKHTVFGRVIEGMEVLGELQRVTPGERGVFEDKITEATVLRDRGHDYQFKKLPGR